jgi:thioredoxin 2
MSGLNQEFQPECRHHILPRSDGKMMSEIRISIEKGCCHPAPQQCAAALDGSEMVKIMENLVITCPQCQTQNRIPAEKLGQTVTCKKCGTTFSTPETVADQPIVVTDATFEQEVLQSPVPVLMDVWAPWCGPCRMIAPVVGELAKEFAGRAKVVKLNSDENQRVPSQYHIQGIPTLLFFKNGELVDSLIGAVPKFNIQQKLQQIV